jgi:HAD superfamily hydrolase (TIGR01509 family)
LLDVDGTLVASNAAHARAWHAALAEHGIEVPVAQLSRLIGMGGDKLLPAAAGIDAASDLGKQVSERRAAIFRSDELPALQPTRGAAELLTFLRANGVRLMVASSADAAELGALLAVCGAPELADDAATGDDAAGSKPDPDIVQVALDRIALPATDVLLLGDTPYDVAAGRRAGVDVVAVTCGGWSENDLAGAVSVVADPAELQAIWPARVQPRRVKG